MSAVGSSGTARTRVAVPLALLLVVLAGYAMPVFGGATFVSRDHLTHTLPSKQYVAESIAAGRLPEWWDGVDLGVPFAANPNHSALYPPTWVTAVLPSAWGTDVLLIAHVLLAALGASALARAFGAGPGGQVVAGTGFALSGFMTSTVVHGGPLLTLAWAPWAAVFADRVATATTRRDALHACLVLTAILTAQLHAGDPSFAIIGGLTAFGIGVARAQQRVRTALMIVASAVAAALLAAIIVLPALALLGETMRGHLDSARFDTWSMHPLRLLEWVWPDLLGNPNEPGQQLARVVANTADGGEGLGPSWALSSYVGATLLVTAAVGWVDADRRTRAVAVVTILALVLAFGRFTPLYALFRAAFPPEQLVRYPEKYASGALLIVAALAGRGFSTLIAARPSRRMVRALIVVTCLFAAGVAVTWTVGRQLAHAVTGNGTELSYEGVEASAAYAAQQGASALIAALLVALGVILAWRHRLRSWGIAIAVVAFSAHHVVRVWQLLPLIDRAIIERPPALLANIERRDDDIRRRIHRPRQLPRSSDGSLVQIARAAYETAIQNSAARFGYADVPGYDQAHSRRLAATWKTLSRPWMIALYGVELAIVPDGVARAEGMTPIASGGTDGHIVLARPPHSRPRAFSTNDWVWHADEASARESLATRRSQPPTPDVLAQVQLVGAGTSSTPATPVLHPCVVRSPYPERLVVQCNAPVAGFLILLDTYFPGWSARVDGTPTPIVLADGLVRAVPLAAGAHEIVFQFRTPGLVLGAVGSLVGWLGWGIAFFLVRRRSRRCNDQSVA